MSISFDAMNEAVLLSGGSVLVVGHNGGSIVDGDVTQGNCGGDVVGVDCLVGDGYDFFIEVQRGVAGCLGGIGAGLSRLVVGQGIKVPLGTFSNLSFAVVAACKSTY